MTPRARKAIGIAAAGRTAAWNMVHRFEGRSDTFRGKIAGAIANVEAAAAENLRRAPYTTLAAAGMTGFVLGGGLTPRVLIALTMLGARSAMYAVAEELLVERLVPKSTQPGSS